MWRSARNWISRVKATPLEQARDNLREALELFFQSASPEEIAQRFHEEVFVTRVGVAVG